QALKHSRAAGHTEGEAWSQLNIGWARIYRGHYEQAVGALSTARQQFAVDSNLDGVMKSTNALGVLSFRIGEVEQAGEFWREDLRLATESGNVGRRIAACNNLGELASAAGDHAEALQRYQEALGLAKERSDEAAQAVIGVNLGRVHLDLGEHAVALHELQEAFDLAAALDDRITQAEALTQIGRALVMEHGGEDPDGSAESLHLQSVELCEEIGHPAGEIEALEHLATLLIAGGRLEEAEEHVRTAVALARRTDARIGFVETIETLARSLAGTGDLEHGFRVISWIVELQREHAGADTARRVRALRARHELEQARMEAEIVRLRNVELREKSRELEFSNKKLQLMNRIGSELTSTLDPDEIARRLHDRLNELMRAEVFGVAFYDAAEQSLDYAVVIEDNQRLAPFYVSVAEVDSFSSWVVRHRREIVLNDADREYRQYITNRSSLSGKPCSSLVFLPLELEGRIIGVLTVQSRRKRMYGPEETATLQLLVPYIAIAMDNARKVQTIRDLNAALERDKSELEDAYSRIAHMANHDMLTQLPNRRLLAELVGEYIPLARRHGRIFGLLYIDLDDFKPVNDTYGHETGDRVLVQMANRLSAAVRESDTIARIGGDEFVLVVRDIARPQDVVAIARKVLEIVGEPVRVAGVECRVAASIGVSMFPTDGGSYDDLLSAADSAMYRAKQAGKAGIAGPESRGQRSRVDSSEESMRSPSNTNRPST
ncbi:MAG: diguanylate cyclase domain-containing protein, partial [Spirochaetota bacterium]